MSETNNILIIGKPKTGKSCFKGQFYTKLSDPENKVKKYKETENQAAILEIINSQELGINPDRTSKEKDEQTIFHLEFPDGKRADLIWPDYAGEKITDIVSKRKLAKSWLPLVQNSSVWMLFINLNDLKPLDTLLQRPQENAKRKANKKDDKDFKFEISDYAFYVELLQILLYHRGLGTMKKINTPTLQIVLTFWDELKDNDHKNPKDELSKRCPMLVNFLDSIWVKNKISYAGLSPQGLSLGKNQEEAEQNAQIQEFIEAPEDFGYFILDEGEKEEDLTLLIHQAIQL